MLRHGLQAGIDAWLSRTTGGCTPVFLLDECTHGNTGRGAKRRPAGVATWIGRRNCSVVDLCDVHRVEAIVPVVATERTAWQRILHDVVELAIAGKDLDLAV